MNLTNKVFSLLGFAEPVNLSRFNGDNLLPEATIVISLESELAKVIETSLNHLPINQLKVNHSIGNHSIGAMVIDATGYQSQTSFKLLYQNVKNSLKLLNKNARIVIVGDVITAKMSPEQCAFSQSLTGFSKSLAKEVGRKGTTVNLLLLEPQLTSELDGALQFFLSTKSTFVSGQSITVKQCSDTKVLSDNKAKKLALVTGASQGIGASIAQTLARDNYKVVGLDIEQAQEKLAAEMAKIDGDCITLDISAENAGQVITEYLKKYQEENQSAGFDLVVHNAGITRDKMLTNMPEHWWTSTLDINLLSVIRVNDYLLAHQGINANGRIVCMSSMNGIAGQAGQTNYATSKAGLIGYVKHLSQALASKDITINAVAPGFIETKMTEQIPFVTREMGRRMNALGQGGQVEDVAEAVAFFAQPQSYSVTGQTLRVCGLNFIGA